MWKPRPREESLVESCPGVALCSWVWRVPGNRKRKSGFCSWGEGPDTQLTLMIQRALVGRETTPLHPGQQRGRPAHSGPLRQHQKPKEPVTDLGPDSASTNPCAQCESHTVLQVGRGQVWDVEPREQGKNRSSLPRTLEPPPQSPFSPHIFFPLVIRLISWPPRPCR